MLRRYSSRNLETIPIQSKVLTIGTDKCDIKLNAKGVHPIHASIEQNPKSGSFWLRDHSLAGHTSVNGHTVNGQVELHNGDLVRIGKAQPYVFEKRVVLPLVSSNTSNEDLASNSSLEVGLPVLGKRISPLPPQSKSRRPLTAVAKFRRNVNNNSGNEKGSVLNEEVGTISPPSSIETCSESSLRSGIKRTIHNRGSVGNHLLQRVIRLQDEVARKNAELDELRRHRCTCQEVPQSPARKNYFQLPKSLPPVVNSYNNRNFELEAYRAFLAAVATKVRSFNNFIVRTRFANYSDVFSAFHSITNEPFTQQMIEIEKECDIELERKGFSALQRSQLADFFRNDRREYIASLASELELLFPIIRDACDTASESIRVCSVFTQWSRHLGEQIRVSGISPNQLLEAVDNLKRDFTRNQMENHWLLPSLSPLLALTAQELEKSRETSSIGETSQTVDDSFSRMFHQSNKNATIKTDTSNSETGEKLESLDRILFDVEEKSVQLEKQLTVLERKISESKDINHTTRERINQLLLRLNTSSCLIHRSCNAESDNERKESTASVFSLKVTGDDLQHAARYNADNMEENSVQMGEYEAKHSQKERTNTASNSSHLSDSPDTEARANTHSSTEAVELDNSRDDEVKEERAEAITTLNEMQQKPVQKPGVKSTAQKIFETGIEENHTEKSVAELKEEQRVDDKVEKIFLLRINESPIMEDGCDVPEVLSEENGLQRILEHDADDDSNQSENQEIYRNAERTSLNGEKISDTTEQADQAERRTQTEVPPLSLEDDADNQTHNELQKEDKDVSNNLEESLLEKHENSSACSQDDFENPHEIDSEEYTLKESVDELDGRPALRKLSSLTERSEDSDEGTGSMELKFSELNAMTAKVTSTGYVNDVVGMENEGEHIETPENARDAEETANVQVRDKITDPFFSRVLGNEVLDKIENEAQGEVTDANESHVDADILDNELAVVDVDVEKSTAFESRDEEAPVDRLVDLADINEDDANLASGAEGEPVEKLEQLVEEQSSQGRNSEIEETNTSGSLNDDYSAGVKVEEIRNQLSCEEVEQHSISEPDSVSNKQEEEKNAKDSFSPIAENNRSESNDNKAASAENQQSASEYNEEEVIRTRVDENSVGAGTVPNGDRGFDEHDSNLSSVDLHDEIDEVSNVEDQDVAQTITTGSTFDEIDIGRQSSLASVLKDAEARLVRFPSEILHAEVSTLRKEKEFDEAPMRSLSLSPQLSETLSSLGVIALPEFELTHKYHIQSHINTASRIPVTIQPVPLQTQQFRSPPMKRTLSETGKDAKQPLNQRRFIF